MLYFFDIDGTLSAPRYESNGHKSIGFSDEEWKDYVAMHTETAYDKCVVVKPVYKYALKLKSERHKLFILSTIADYNEMVAKHFFLMKKDLVTGEPKRFIGDISGYINNEDGLSLFQRDLYVHHDNEKVSTILKMAEEFGVEPSECALVDDSFGILLDAHNAGIMAIHPTNIITNTVTG